MVFSNLHSAENLNPEIAGSATFRVHVNEESVYNFQVVDPGDNFTVDIEDGLPSNPLLHDLGNGDYRFVWNLMEVTNIPLVILATDSRNATSVHIPIVEVCACTNNGICTVDGLLTTNTTITMACICGEGNAYSSSINLNK